MTSLSDVRIGPRNGTNGPPYISTRNYLRSYQQSMMCLSQKSRDLTVYQMIVGIHSHIDYSKLMMACSFMLSCLSENRLNCFVLCDSTPVYIKKGYMLHFILIASLSMTPSPAELPR